MQRVSDLAVLTLQFLFDGVNKTLDDSCLRFAVFVYCERKHSSTAFLYNVSFSIELNTTFTLFEVALKEASKKVVLITCKKFLNSDRAVPWMCTCD